MNEEELYSGKIELQNKIDSTADTPGSEREEEKRSKKLKNKEHKSDKNNWGTKRVRKLNDSPEIVIHKRHSQARRKNWKKAISLKGTSVEEILGITERRETQVEENLKEMEELKKTMTEVLNEWKGAEKREAETKEWKRLLENINGKLDKNFEELEVKINTIKNDINILKEGFNTDIKRLEEKMENDKKDRKEREQMIEKRLEDLERKIMEKGNISLETQEYMNSTPIWTEEERKTWQEMKWMTEFNKREKKKKNIIIKGLDVKEVKNAGELEKWIKEKMNITVNIKKTWTMKGGNERMIVGAQIETIEEKITIMKNKKELGTQKVYIENDTTYKERRNKELVLMKARQLKDEGHSAKIGYNKVYTNTEEWYWNEKKQKCFHFS